MSNDSSKQYSPVPWSPSRAIAMVVVAMFGGQAIAAVLVLVFFLLAGWSTPRVEAWASTTFGQFVQVCIAEAMALGTVWLFAHKHWPGWGAFGFTRRPRISDVGYALLAGAVYIVLLTVATAITAALLHVDVDQKQQIGFETVVSDIDRILAFISLVILPPIVEEILFRGVLFGSFRKRLAFTWATMFTSLLFAFPHLLQGDQSLLWIGAIDTFVLSVALCYLREHTGSLWASIFLHAMKNSIAYVYLFIIVTK